MTSSAELIQQGLDDEFGVFCRRFCGGCGDRAPRLSGCAVLKLDAYLYLKKNFGMAHTARHLNDEVDKLISEDLKKSTRRTR